MIFEKERKKERRKKIERILFKYNPYIISLKETKLNEENANYNFD
jgi:hypothetical protein